MRLAILVVVIVVCVTESSARSPVYGGRRVSEKDLKDALWWVTPGGKTGDNNGNTNDGNRNSIPDGNNGNNNPVSDRNNNDVGNVDTTTTRPTYGRNNRRNNVRNNRRNNVRNNRRNGRNGRNNVRYGRNNGRYNRNNRRNGRNYGRNRGRTGQTTGIRGNGGYAVGRTRPADTTTTRTTTRPTTTTTSDVCTQLAIEGSCDFYSYPQCLQAALNTCRQPKPLTVWAFHICQLSVLREPEFVGEGVDYIDFFRRCSTVNLLPYSGTNDCAGVNSTILSTVTRDQTQCLFQEGAFCRVIVNPQNCAALFHIFALDHAGEFQFTIFETFNFLITRCDKSAQDTFNDIFVKKFLDLVSATVTTTRATTTTTRMMMGGFGRD